MGSFDLFSQYRRFILGIDSPWTFATWVLRHADDLEPVLSELEWERFLDVELAAAEYTSGGTTGEQFRQRTHSILETAAFPPHPRANRYLILLDPRNPGRLRSLQPQPSQSSGDSQGKRDQLRVSLVH